MTHEKHKRMNRDFSEVIGFLKLRLCYRLKEPVSQRSPVQSIRLQRQFTNRIQQVDWTS